MCTPASRTDFCVITMTDNSQSQNAAVLHALTVGALKRNAAANLQVIFLWSFLVSHGGPTCVVGCVLLQDIASSDHHPCRLRRHGEEDHNRLPMSTYRLM